MAKTAKQERRIKELPPATTPEARQEQMISLAFDLVQERLINGTATAAETTHFLKLATEKEQLERKKLEQDIRLSQAKEKSYETAQHMEQLYEEAMRQFRSYQGEDIDEYFEEDI